MSASAVSERSKGKSGGLKDLAVRLREFYGDVRTETKKVHRPAMKEVRVTTWVVILTVLAFAAFFFVVDAFFSRVVDGLIGYLTR